MVENSWPVVRGHWAEKDSRGCGVGVGGLGGTGEKEYTVVFPSGRGPVEHTVLDDNGVCWTTQSQQGIRSEHRRNACS